MAQDNDEVLRQVRERLAQTEQQLAQMRRKVEETRLTARSADNAIAAVVNGQGELVSIGFGTAKWRRMIPAELGAALVKTVNQARQESRAELMRLYSGLVPEPLRPAGAAEGRINLDEMLKGMLRGVAPSVSQPNYPNVEVPSANTVIP